MSQHQTEIGILADLARELQELETLERFQLGGDASVPRLCNVEVTFSTPHHDNDDRAHKRMGEAFAEAIAESAHDLVRNAVAHQRGVVERLREQLADHYANANSVNGADVGIETYDQMPTTPTVGGTLTVMSGAGVSAPADDESTY